MADFDGKVEDTSYIDRTTFDANTGEKTHFHADDNGNVEFSRSIEGEGGSDDGGGDPDHNSVSGFFTNPTNPPGGDDGGGDG